MDVADDTRSIPARARALGRLAAAGGAAGAPGRLLDERHAVYAGLGAADLGRLRGYGLVQLAEHGALDGALPFIREELETGDDAHAVAGAARALWAAAPSPLEADVTAHLLPAFERFRPADRFVDLAAVAGRPGAPASVLAILMETVGHVAASMPAGTADALARLCEEPPHAFSPPVRDALVCAARAVDAATPRAVSGCCARTAVRVAAPTDPVQRDRVLHDVDVEDQDGTIVPLDTLLAGRWSVLSFFYTRCENPLKCSQTITKLATLRRLCGEQGPPDPFIAAISYDPAYDTAIRLRRYGADRGFAFDERTKLLRTTGGIEPLLSRFDLAVGFSDVTVNRHQTELFILGPRMDVAFALPRQTWRPSEIHTILGEIAP